MRLTPTIVLAAASLFTAAAGCSKASPPSEALPAAPASATTSAITSAGAGSTAAPSGLTRVEQRSNVCMVNDQYMGKEQIAVAVGEKTYYGCCAMCKEKLEKNVSARTATDPVSGRSVDKASAVIGRDASGKVYYFESDETLRRYTL